MEPDYPEHPSERTVAGKYLPNSTVIHYQLRRLLCEDTVKQQSNRYYGLKRTDRTGPTVPTMLHTPVQWLGKHAGHICMMPRVPMGRGL